MDTMSEFFIFHFLRFALQFAKKMPFLLAIDDLILQVRILFVQIENSLALMRSAKKAVRLPEMVILCQFCASWSEKRKSEHGVTI